MSTRFAVLVASAVALLASAIPGTCLAQARPGNDDLAGAWRGKVQFTTGAFAAAKDLDFMYAFLPGGAMTESSNYDSVPPVPPAYGAWKKVGTRKYEAKYQFYLSKPVPSADELIKNGGWFPGGYGTIVQSFTLSPDGNSFESRLTVELFDADGKAMPGGGVASASGKRLGF